MQKPKEVREAQHYNNHRHPPTARTYFNSKKTSIRSLPRSNPRSRRRLPQRNPETPVRSKPKRRRPPAGGALLLDLREKHGHDPDLPSVGGGGVRGRGHRSVVLDPPF